MDLVLESRGWKLFVTSGKWRNGWPKAPGNENATPTGVDITVAIGAQFRLEPTPGHETDKVFLSYSSNASQAAPYRGETLTAAKEDNIIIIVGGFANPDVDAPVLMVRGDQF